MYACCHTYHNTTIMRFHLLVALVSRARQDRMEGTGSEGKELVPHFCVFACTIDAFCCLCFLQIKVDRDVKDKPDQCVS